MVREIFKAVVLTSCVGTALTALLTVAKPLTKRFFSARWNYYIWLAVLSIMILPIKFDLPSKTVAVMPKAVQIAVDAGRTVLMPTAETDVFRVGLAEIWLCGAVVMILVKLVSYMIFLYSILKSGEKFFSHEVEMFIARKITVVKSHKISSPLMTGLFKPTLILPEIKMTERQMKFVIAHEMVHHKRRDIFCKWFVCLVKCIHWFNPIVYYMARQIEIECEISCDLAVTEYMNKDEKIGYADTILELVSAGAKNFPLTTGVATNNGFLKRRIRAIAKRQKRGKVIKLLSITAAVVCLIGTMFVSGTAAGLLLNEVEGKLILSGKLPVIEFSLKQRVEQLRKTSRTETETHCGEDIIEQLESAEHMQQQLPEKETQMPVEEPVGEKLIKPETAKVIKYSTDDKSTHYITLHPDENGLISVYFDSDVKDALAMVNIYDSERPGQGWRYQLPTDGQAAYGFEGFDPERSYTVEINTYCPGNYGIEGKAYVY